jgi:iron complex transport system substrate-binding protein
MNRTKPRLIGLLAAVFGLGLLAQLPASEPGFPLAIKDASGVQLSLSKKPVAIVSLTLASDEILFSLVDKSRLKAIDSYSGDEGISNVAELSKGVALKLGADKEKIIAAQPDLVIVADWTDQAVVKALRDAKLAVFTFKAPKSFEELATAISELGKLTGEGAKAKELQANIDRRLAAVAAKTKAVPADQRPSVLCYTFYGSTYAADTSFDALVTKAGLVNAATKAGLKGWPQLSKEKILELDPDWILMPSWSYDGKADPAKYLADFLADPVFAGLKAVRNKHVVILADKLLQNNSQFMAAGVEALAGAVWPELFR